MVRMQIQFTEAEVEALRSEASQRNVSIAAVVREAVDESLRDGPPAVSLDEPPAQGQGGLRPLPVRARRRLRAPRRVLRRFDHRRIPSVFVERREERFTVTALLDASTLIALLDTAISPTALREPGGIVLDGEGFLTTDYVVARGDRADATTARGSAAVAHARRSRSLHMVDDPLGDRCGPRARRLQCVCSTAGTPPPQPRGLRQLRRHAPHGHPRLPRHRPALRRAGLPPVRASRSRD